MISEIVAGVLVDVITSTGRRLGASAVALGDRRLGKDLEIARWFDTYQLVGDPPRFPDLSPELSERLARFLRGNDAQAALHELLAARLSDAPEADVERVGAVFDLALAGDVPELAGLGGEVFGYYDGQVSELVGRLEGAEPVLLRQIRSEALVARLVAIVGAIERHATALSASGGRQGEAAFWRGTGGMSSGTTARSSPQTSNGACVFRSPTCTFRLSSPSSRAWTCTRSHGR